MNRKQNIVLLIGLLLIVLIAAFPPVLSHIFYLDDDGNFACSYIGYVFICNLYPDSFAFINYYVLIGQIIVVALITGGLIKVFSNKKNKTN